MDTCRCGFNHLPGKKLIYVNFCIAPLPLESNEKRLRGNFCDELTSHSGVETILAVT